MAPADIHLYLPIRTNFCTVVMEGKKMKGDKFYENMRKYIINYSYIGEGLI